MCISMGHEWWRHGWGTACAPHDRLWPSACGDSPIAQTFEEPSSRRPWGIFLFNSADFEPNSNKKGEKKSPQDLLYGPWVLTVTCVCGCSPAICAQKRQGGLKSVTLICIDDHIPVLFTTVFLFPKTITLLVEKVDLSTSCLKLFVYQKNGFCTTCASASTKNRADLLKPERMHSSLYGFMSSRRLNFFQC